MYREAKKMIMMQFQFHPNDGWMQKLKNVKNCKEGIKVESKKQQQQKELHKNQLNTKIDMKQMLLSDKIQKTKK